MKLAIAGASGRMGRAIAELVNEEGHHDPISLSRDSTFEHALSADAIIDFTRPDYAVTLAGFAAEHGLPLISGTTGFDDAQWQAFTHASQTIPLFWASNMSLGVALLSKLVREAAAALPESYDIEVLEMHHRDKIDAPSGTALSLGRTAAHGRGAEFEANAILSREGQTGPRAPGSIGFATLRGGQVIGEHRVLFAGEREVIELAHRSQSRAIYAEGALRAAVWLQGKAPGLYGMDHLLAG